MRSAAGTTSGARERVARRVPKGMLPRSHSALRAAADRHDVKLCRLGPVFSLGPVQLHIAPV